MNIVRVRITAIMEDNSEHSIELVPERIDFKNELESIEADAGFRQWKATGKIKLFIDGERVNK